MRRLSFSLAAAAILLLTGCVTSRQARDVKPSGFLGTSASLLEKGKQGEETLLVYHQHDINWASYEKVIRDSRICCGRSSPGSRRSPVRSRSST